MCDEGVISVAGVIKVCAGVAGVIKVCFVLQVCAGWDMRCAGCVRLRQDRHLAVVVKILQQ